MNLDYLDELIQALKKPTELRTYDDTYQIEKLVRRVEFFKKIQEEQLNPEIFTNLSLQLEHDYAGPNQTIFNIDSMGEKFYVILQGEVGVYVKMENNSEEQKSTSQKLLDKVKQRFRKTQNNNKYKDYLINNIQTNLKDKDELILAKTLKDGQAFGELSLINNRPRLATIIALAPTHFAVLRKSNFKKILKVSQEQKLLKEMGFFAQQPLFENWNVNLIRYIYLNSQLIQCRIGHQIFQVGDKVENIYIIKSGTFDLQYSFQEETNEKSIFDKNNSKISNFFLKKYNKNIVRNIGTVGAGQILALEDLNSLENKHTFSCICSSSNGEIIAISQQIYLNKIATQQTSQHYIQEYCKNQKEFWNNRLISVSKQIDSYRKTRKDNSSIQFSNSIDDEQKIFILHQQGNLMNQTLDYNQMTKINIPIRIKEELPQISKIPTKQFSDHSTINHDTSFLQRAQDRSVMGKVQTQILYHKQAYRKLKQGLSLQPDQNSISTDRIAISLFQNIKDKSKTRVPYKSQILNETEVKIIHQVLNGPPVISKQFLKRTETSTKQIQNRKLTPYQQRKLNYNQSHTRVLSVNL